jgi:hypothetical protein
MNKNDLFLRLQKIYPLMDIPEPLEPEKNGVTPYIINIFETGESESGIPLAVRRNIPFYVFNEGKDNEEAYVTGTLPPVNNCKPKAQNETEADYYARIEVTKPLEVKPVPVTDPIVEEPLEG